MTAVEIDPRVICPAAGTLPSTRPHGSYSAAKENRCTCPGAGQDSYRAYKARTRSQRGGDGEVNRVKAPPFYSPAVPEPVHDADTTERELLTRRDLNCLGEDVNLFFPVGRGEYAIAQAAAAKRICASCPALALCAEVMLNRADTDGIAGGMDPDERREARRVRGVS